MKHDFEDIEVKRNAPMTLESQLRRKRKPCMISTGSMCDHYTRLEDELQVTRQCLTLIEKYGFGLAIQTKSAGILRDIDLLKAINANTKCVVQVTLTTYDEGLCSKIEPNVSTTTERYQVLEAMREACIPTVVWISPILPYINDTEENLRGLLDYCCKAKVHGILCFGFGVTMRGGSREYFYTKLDEQFPGVKQQYIRKFGSSYECKSVNNNLLTDIIHKECKRHGILNNVNDIFVYLRKFESKTHQTMLFN